MSAVPSTLAHCGALSVITPHWWTPHRDNSKSWAQKPPTSHTLISRRVDRHSNKWRRRMGETSELTKQQHHRKLLRQPSHRLRGETRDQWAARFENLIWKHWTICNWWLSRCVVTLRCNLDSSSTPQLRYGDGRSTTDVTSKVKPLNCYERSSSKFHLRQRVNKIKKKKKRNDFTQNIARCVWGSGSLLSCVQPGFHNPGPRDLQNLNRPKRVSQNQPKGCGIPLPSFFGWDWPALTQEQKKTRCVHVRIIITMTMKWTWLNYKWQLWFRL